MISKLDKLAIIIPAYKDAFLDATLNSLVKQTNKDFVVYIGDDASPYEIGPIVQKYAGQLDIAYHRFESNLGGKDLVGQWERCIALTQGESWLWLFSDDDAMDDNCVERFYKEIEKNENVEFVHFNVNVIDENGKKLDESVFPKWIGSYTFALSKFKGLLKSYVVEYVFSRDLYERIGGFKNYDLAWNSDDATWVTMAMKNGILTIDGARVNWRKSALNISPNVKDVLIVKRKIDADLKHVCNMNSLFLSPICNFRLGIAMMTWFCVNMIKYQKALSFREQMRYIWSFSNQVKKKYLFPVALAYFFVKKRFL